MTIYFFPSISCIQPFVGGDNAEGIQTRKMFQLVAWGQEEKDVEFGALFNSAFLFSGSCAYTSTNWLLSYDFTVPSLFITFFVKPWNVALILPRNQSSHAIKLKVSNYEKILAAPCRHSQVRLHKMVAILQQFSHGKIQIKESKHWLTHTSYQAT